MDVQNIFSTPLATFYYLLIIGYWYIVLYKWQRWIPKIRKLSDIDCTGRSYNLHSIVHTSICTDCDGQFPLTGFKPGTYRSGVWCGTNTPWCIHTKEVFVCCWLIKGLFVWKQIIKQLWKLPNKNLFWSSVNISHYG